MKLLNKNSVLISFVSIFFLINCKEETPVTPDTRTKVQLMQVGPWKWTASTCDTAIDIDGMNGASKDIHGQYPICFKDDIYTFKADSTTSEAANTKCTTEGTYKGSWIFTNGEKNLRWTGKDFKTRKYALRDYTIIELTDSKMVLRYLEVAANNYLITNTYTH
ncbi:MAG: lipocalin family protein [Bacteroidia bacterium]